MSIREDMDKQLAAKSWLTPGKVCGACREPKQHTEDCSAVLKAELAAKEAELTRLRELLWGAVRWLDLLKGAVEMRNGFPCALGPITLTGTNAFLSLPEIKALMKEGG